MNSWIFASICANENFQTSILPTAFCLLNCFLMSISSLQFAVVLCPMERNSSTKLSSSFPSLTLVENRPCNCFGRTSMHTVLFCCVQCHEVQNMRNLLPRVSEELLQWVQVTPYHPHNSVNLPRHLLHSTLYMLLGGDGLGHLYIHYTTKGISVPLAGSHLNNGMSLIMSYPTVP